MPEATVQQTGGKIALGFGLEGYTIAQPQNAVNPTSINISVGSGVELDGHFMKDTELKQDYIDLEHYLSFPIEYKNKDGQAEYAMYKDSSSNTDSAHTTGTLAYGGACCPLLGASPAGSANSPSSGIGQRILAAESALKEYNGGNTTDFLVGAAVNPKTILDYFSHFYPSAQVTEQHINKLCQKGLLNAEVLFNFGGGKGKAFRLKIVDTYKTENKFCVMSVFFMTSALKSYCPLTGSHLDKTFSNARNDGYKFPLEDKRYDYKSGTIAGYNPNYIRSIADYIKFDFSGSGNLTQFGVSQENAGGAKCRVRYFIDEGKKGEAGTVCTTLPDELFKTNYSDGSEQTFENTTVSIISGDVDNEKILQVVRMLGPKVANYSLNNHKTIYNMVGGDFVSGGSKFGTQYWYSGLNTLTTRDGRTGPFIDCSGWVTWVLLEAGCITPGHQITTGFYHRRGNTCGAVSRLKPGYSLQLIANERDVKMGDIISWPKHVGIAAQDGSFRKEYGMGSWQAIQRFADSSDIKMGDHGGATHAWRVVKNANTTNVSVNNA